MQAVFKEPYPQIETVYTYSEWEKECTKKNRQQRKLTLYYFKQRLSGFTMAIIGIIVPLILDGDATISLITLPLGLYLIFTKERVMTF